MNNRCCENCGHCWRTKRGPEWILLCPKCRVSGYHSIEWHRQNPAVTIDLPDKWPWEK